MRAAEGDKGGHVKTTYPDYIQAVDVSCEAELTVGWAVEGSFWMDTGAADNGHHFLKDAALWQGQDQILVCLNVGHNDHTFRLEPADIHIGFLSGSLALVLVNWWWSVCQTVNLCPAARQLLFKPFVAPIQVINAVDYGFSFCCQTGKY